MNARTTPSATSVAVAAILVASLIIPAVVAAPAGASNATARSNAAATGFADVDPASAHARAILRLVADGAMKGIGAERFDPVAPMTRGQLASVVFAVSDLPRATASPFTEIGGSVHAPAIHSLNRAGVIHGTSATTFEPDRFITRAHLAAILVRMEAPSGGERDQVRLSMAEQNIAPRVRVELAGHSHEQDLLLAHQLGYLQGTSDGSIEPNRHVSRGQAATMLDRFRTRDAGSNPAPGRNEAVNAPPAAPPSEPEASSPSEPEPESGQEHQPPDPVTGRHTVPSTIDATCSTDVTAALNDWLATVPDGTADERSVVDLAGGCFLSNGTVWLNERNNLVIDGAGATIKATEDPPEYSNRAQLGITLGQGFLIRDLTLQGTNPAARYNERREFDHNLRFWGVQDVLVDNVTLRKAWGDAVSLHPAGSGARPTYPGNWSGTGEGAVLSTNITVQNSSVDGTGRHAFTCSGCRNFLVQDNHVQNVGYHFTDVEVEAKTWTGDVTLLRNTYRNVYLSLLAATTGGGVNPGPFIVRDNVQLDHPTTCIQPIWIGDHGRPVGQVEITGNTLFSYSNGVSIRNATGVDITGNTIKVGGGGCFKTGTTDPNDGRRGALLWNITDVRVTNNTFLNAGEVAKVDNSTGVHICSNRFSTTHEYKLPSSC